jgi:membrane-associated phospholipid phosphatase
LLLSHRQLYFLILICTAVLRLPIAAAEEPVLEKPAPPSFAKTALLDFSSPVTTSARTVFFSGMAATLAFRIFANDLDMSIQEKVSRDQPLGASSHYGDLAGQMIPNAIYAVGMWADGFFEHPELSNGRALLMVKSSLYSGAAALMLKGAIQERRPDGSDHFSFPSGHATTAFAFASVVGAEHETVYGIMAYALASFSGFSRINDNRHYLHDVMAGAALGTAYGLGLYERSHKSSTSIATSQQPKATWAVLPGDEVGSVYLSYRQSW